MWIAQELGNAGFCLYPTLFLLVFVVGLSYPTDGPNQQVLIMNIGPSTLDLATI
jgi:hypothetical protein